MANNDGRYRRRLLVNRWNLAMSLLTMAFGMTFLLWILFTLFLHGFEALAPKLFMQMTPPPGSCNGGLLNAITGSLIMTFLGMIIGTPLGLLAGTYMAEYGRYSKLATLVRALLSRIDRGELDELRGEKLEELRTLMETE